MFRFFITYINRLANVERITLGIFLTSKRYDRSFIHKTEKRKVGQKRV